MRKGRTVVGWVVVATTLGAVVACRHAPAPVPEGCGSDKDCKLDRVCNRGRCVWELPPVAVTAARAPTDAAGAITSAPPTLTPGAAGLPGQAMFRAGPEHRGRSPFRLPRRKPDVAWAFSTMGPVSSTPAIATDGTVAVGSHDGRLYVFDGAGRPRFLFSTTDMIFSSPAITTADAVIPPVIYVGSDDDHLYAIDMATGQSRWRFRVGACRETQGVGPEASRCDVDAGPTIGGDGTIYTGGDGLYAIRPDGTLKWKFATAAHVSSAPALLPDGTVVAGCQDNVLYAIAPDGTKRWDFRAGDDIESAPAIGDDGTVYVGSDDHKLYALAPNGTLRWAFTTGGDVRAGPAIAHDGSLLVGAFDALFYAIKPDGTLSWTFRTGDRIMSSALVDAEGAILFGSQDDRLYALEPDGRPRWSIELGGDVDSSPVLDKDGTIYVGSDDRKLYALRASSDEPVSAAERPTRTTDTTEERYERKQ